MSKQTDEEIVTIVDQEFESAMGNEGGEISIERAKAWDFYLSKPVDELIPIEGQSKVVTSDVSDVIDGVMPSLLRIFTTADNLVAFDAFGPEDMESAAQESDYVNYVFFKQNPSFSILYTWFFDALVQKNGIVKAWWDDSEVVTQEGYQGLSEIELFSLLEDDELEIVERSTRLGKTVGADGQLVEGDVHDVTFRRTSSRGQVRIENVPPEEYRISSDSRSLNPSEARFVGHEKPVKRADLLEMGFDPAIVEDLPAEGTFPRGPEAIARYDKSDDDQEGVHDPSQDEILLREGYVRLGKKAELTQVFVAGNTFLSKEVVDGQPFHVISPQPLPHKHFGRSHADKIMDVQKVSSILLRQILDNLYHTNNPGHAVWDQGMGENTLDDLLTSRAGKVATFTRPVGESWTPIVVPFTAAASFPMLEYWDKVKRDRTGISTDSEGLSPEALKNVQTSVLMQSVDMSKMKIETVARVFAETGIKTLLLHIHELLQKHQDKEQVVQLRNKWVQVNPQEWRTRIDMTVNIGLGIGTREQNLMHLQAIWDKQTQIVQAGGMGLLVSPSNIFKSVSEFVKNANLKDPTMFFTDPGDKPFPPPNDEQAELQKQQQALVQRQQELDGQKQALDAQKQQLSQAKAVMDNRQAQEKLQIERDKVNNKMFIDLEEIKNTLTKIEVESNKNIPGSRI